MFDISALQKEKLISNLVFQGYRIFEFNLVNQNMISEINTSSIDFSKYRLRIEIDNKLDPWIFMVSPTIKQDCPHKNWNESLCLYHSSEFQWYHNPHIGFRYILILYTWIFYYDIWLNTDIWYGDEYPHNKK